jgi:hypothetical protein
MEKTFRLIKIALPLVIVVLCLFGQTLNRYCGIFREFQAALLSADWMLLGCLTIWCGTFIFLTFSRKDWSLITLLLIAIFVYFIGHAESWRAADAANLLAGVTLGNRRWRLQFRCRGSRRRSAVAQLFSLGSMTTP